MGLKRVFKKVEIFLNLKSDNYMTVLKKKKEIESMH